MKVICPDCKEKFDLSVNECDEGDSIECPECSQNFTVIVKSGRFRLVSEKEKYFNNEIESYEDEDF